MAEINVQYYVVFGSGDASDDVDYTTELSDEEMVAWEEASKEGIPFDKYPPLEGAVARIYEEVCEQAQSDFEDSYYGDDEDEYDEEDEDDEGGFQDGWTVGIRWPR